jgi:hypothetical protein
MATAYKSQGTAVATETSGGNCNPTCPATVDSGDILVAHVYFEGTTTAPDTPANWTLLDGPRTVESTIGRMWIYGKIADGSEDGTAVSFGTQAVTTMRGARIYSYSGRVSGSITDLVRGFAFLSHATDPQMPSVTTTVADSLAAAMVIQNDNNALTAATGESGGDWVESVAEAVFALTPGMVLQHQHATMASIGTISGGAVAATNDPSGVIAYEVRPSAPPPAQTLDGVLFTKAPTFPQGAVTTLTTLTGVLFAKAPTFPQGAVTSVYTLTGVLFSKAPTFPTGEVVPVVGGQTLTGVLFAKAPTFPQGSVALGVVYSQAGFRGYLDDAVMGSATAKAAENVGWTQTRDENFRVRFVVDETGGGTFDGANDFKMQYRKNGGTWTDVNATSSNVRTSASTPETNNAATTRLLSSGTGTFVAGTFDENNGAAGTASTIDNGELTELEYCAQVRSAEVAQGDVIELRLVRTVGTVVFATYSQIPTLAIAWTLTGVLFSKAPTFPQGAVQAKYTLTGVLFAKAPTFPQGAVQAKYTLTGVLFARTPTFPQGAVQARYTLAGVLFARTPTFPQGQVSLLSGPQDLTGVLFTKAPTFPIGQVRLTQNVTGVLFTRTPTFFTGQVTSVYTVTGVTFAKAPTFFIGQVRSVFTVTGVLFIKSGTFFVGSVVAGAATLQGVVFVRSPSFPIGAVIGGAQMGRITRKPAEYSPITRKRGAYGSIIRK